MMNTATMMLAIEDEDGPVCECSVDEFCAANEDTFSDVDRADLAHLPVGGKAKFGGGAAAVFTVERLS